jgi:hypothetical protein
MINSPTRRYSPTLICEDPSIQPVTNDTGSKTAHSTASQPLTRRNHTDIDRDHAATVSAACGNGSNCEANVAKS